MPDVRPTCEVAIVGIGLRVPPDTTGPEAFWDFLERRGDAVGEVPPDRWSWKDFYDPDPAKPGRMDMVRGAFLRQRIDEFDAAFFGVSPREAAQLDPQQRLLLEVSWEALEDAGADIWGLRGSPTGVYVGAFMLDIMMQLADPGSRDAIGPQTALTCTNTVLASRLAYAYDLRGPAMAIDTACSSSLVAVHQAARALASGECDLALAGGVNRIFRPEPSLMMSKGRFLAPDGRSKSFSANADGYGRGEGCGIVVLKRLEDAVRDGERIYAVIEASAVNQDGRTGGPALPSSAAQAELMTAVASRAGVDPATIAYVEAHGTGTAVGDPAEMAAIGAVVGKATGRSTPCVVGSVKAGVGHLEGAAGVVGLVKAALVAQRGVVPPQAWLDELNPDIPFEELGLQVAGRPIELDRRGDAPTRVAVNSFGYGGTNAHALLRSHASPPAGSPGHRSSRPTHESPVGASPAACGFFPPIVLLSAHTEDALRVQAEAYAREVGAEQADPTLLAAYAARTAHEHRRAVLGDPDAFADRLDQLATGGAHPDIVSGRASGNRSVAPVFVFSGMGPQWWAMGRDLLGGHPTFRAHAERCDEHIRRTAGWSVLDALLSPETESRMARTEVAQPANVVLQTGLVVVFAELGVTPAAVLGHSVGEVAAAYASGALSLEDALTVAVNRATLQSRTAGSGGMLATDLSEDEALEAISVLDGVSIAAVNSPTAVTIAGDAAALAELGERLERRGRFCRMLRVEVAYHSPTMLPILDELHDALAGVTPRAPSVRRYSTVAASYDAAPWDAAYWVRNVADPVAFHTACRRALGDGHRLFLELGPHPVLGLYLQPMLTPADGGRSIPTLHRDKRDSVALVEAAAQLWLRGVPVDWAPVLGRRRAASLPTYPWRRQRHWQDTPASLRYGKTVDASAPAADGHGSGTAVRQRLMGGTLAVDEPPSWDIELSPTSLPWVRSHIVGGTPILPGTALLETLLTHALRKSGDAFPVAIEDVRIDRPVVLPDGQDPLLRVVEGHDGRLAISSRRRGALPGPWQAHASGRVSRGRFDPPSAGPSGPEALTGPTDDVERLYSTLTRLGLDYRGDFRAVTAIRSEASATEAELVSPSPVGQGYATYPPLLDAAIHGTIAALLANEGALYIPVRVGRVLLYSELGERAVARCRLVASGTRHHVVDIDVFSPGGVPIARLSGVEVRRVDHPSSADAWLDERTYEPVWSPAPDLRADGDRPARWVIVGEGQRSKALHAAFGDAVVSNGPVDSLRGLEGREGVVIDLRGAAGSDDQEAIALAERVRGLVQSAVNASEVVLLTEDAVVATPGDRAAGWTMGWVSGFRRAAANESDGVHFRHVDVCHAHSDERLVDIITARDDDELALRGRDAMEPALAVRTSGDVASTWFEAAAEWHVDDVENRRLVATGTGLSAVAWVAERRRSPGPHELELRVESVGLNHKDVLKQLGMVDDAMSARSWFGTSLGMEQSVVVERVGAQVTGYRVGDRLLAGLRDGFRRYVVVDPDDERLFRCRPEWSPLEAAGVLISFFSAHRVLAELARVAPDDVILLHGATGGFGQAALQVARDLGARVFATASTPDKRALLQHLGAERVFGSRTFDFVDGVLAATDGRGVDVVVNTLPGDGLRAALQCVSEDGRVVEVGKHELGGGGSLPLSLLDKNVSLISFDLDYFSRDRERVLALGDRVLARFDAGAYRPLPTTAVPAAQVAAALNGMARSEYVGKVVVELGDTRDVRCREPRGPAGPVRPDRCYVISGGSGAIGMRAALWLSERGARRIALLSRSGAIRDDDVAGKEALAHLSSAGVTVLVRSVDVTDRDAVAAALDDIRRAAGPIGGVVHAAGIAHDLPLMALGQDDVGKVMAPKLSGALNLHRATIDDPVDLFIVTSSVSSLTGTSGQAPYAAANASIEAFVHWRRRRKLPATALALGPVAEVGMAAFTDEVARYVRIYGFDPLPPYRLSDVFDRAIEWNRPVIGVFDVDWERWALAEPRAAASRRFESLATSRARPEATWERLAGLGDDERVDALARIVADGLAKILGFEQGQVAPDTPMATLGLDSLMLIELQTHLNDVVGAELSLMGLLGIDTVLHVARSIDMRLSQREGLTP